MQNNQKEKKHEHGIAGVLFFSKKFQRKEIILVVVLFSGDHERNYLETLAHLAKRVSVSQMVRNSILTLSKRMIVVLRKLVYRSGINEIKLILITKQTLRISAIKIMY